MVNEFRTGFNLRQRGIGEATTRLPRSPPVSGLENAPSKAEAFGFPSFQFTAGTFRPLNIADASRNVDRRLKQNAFSISDNITWIKGGHALKAGGLFTRNFRP